MRGGPAIELNEYVRRALLTAVGAEAAADAVIAQARTFNHPAPFLDDVTLVILDRKA